MRSVLVIGMCTAAVLLATAMPADALPPTLGNIAGYSTAFGSSVPTTTQVGATFVVPSVVCTGSTAGVLFGTSVWDHGGNDVGAAVRVTCGSGSSAPSYSAVGFYYSTQTLKSTVTPVMQLVAGQVIRATSIAGSIKSTAVIHNVTTGASKTVTFGPTGAGSSLVGAFCTHHWNVAGPCARSPKFNTVTFTNVLVDGAALSSFAPTATKMAGTSYVVTPSGLGPAGKAFVDKYL
ncbi:MAG: hypothetical protein ACHQFZ_02760 [Acidimicrobiales bacterium]